MSDPLGPGPRTRVRRQPQLAHYDEASVFTVFDAAPFCHVAGVLDGRAVVVPTLHVRRGRCLYVHGSPSNATFAAVLASGDACVSAVIYDGLRLARSGFESSIAYRSVVAYGPIRVIDDAEEKRQILNAFVDASVPGRSSEIRAPSERELQRTSVLCFDINEASVKASAGPTDDEDDDLATETWSGVVPAYPRLGAPLTSNDGTLAMSDVPVPPSVLALVTPTSDPRVERIAAQVRALVPVDLREQRSVAALLDRLRWPIDCFDEVVDPRHVTASAFVISPRGVILHRHRILHIWVQPGGHVDGGEDPETAAVREVREETGLDTWLHGAGQIFHVDVHQGPRGHTHYDLRYVVVSAGEDPSPPVGESPDVAWFSVADALERAEGTLRLALEKLAPIVDAEKDGTLER
jgi:uncharacterized protein